MGWVTKAITTTGSSGSATGQEDITLVEGGTSILHSVYIKYHTQHANTDVTISEVLPNGDTRTLLTVSNNNTSRSYVPKQAVVDSSGAAIANAYELYVVGNLLRVSVAQGNAGDPGVTVSVMVV